MKIIRKKDKIASVPDRFAKKYEGRFDHKIYHRIDEKRVSVGGIVDALCGIGAYGNSSEPMIVAAIGNDSWTRMECDVCTKDCEFLVRFDGSDDSPVDICEDCLEAALEMLYKCKEKDDERT